MPTVTFITLYVSSSPSLRGSGLKFPCRLYLPLQAASPSLRGSGLKCVNVCSGRTLDGRLPLYEGVD